MNRKWIRIALLLAAVCLTGAAVAPNASASCLLIFHCTTEGDTMYFQDGCCNVGLFGPTYRNRLYVCHNGCFQRTNTTKCTIDPCV
jgi:hypothetical protein